MERVNYIGYEDEYYGLKDALFPGGRGWTEEGWDDTCVNLVGPNNIGKTAMLERLHHDLQAAALPNTYLFPVNMVGSANETEFWQRLLNVIKAELPPEALEQAWEALPPNEQKAGKVHLDQLLTYYDTGLGCDYEPIKHFFQCFNVLHLHVIIAIDDLDVAAIQKGQDVTAEHPYAHFFPTIFQLSPKSFPRAMVKLLLISRRQLQTIAHHMTKGSFVDSCFQSKILRGFMRGAELDEYFAQLPFTPTKEQREDVLYYCGRSPGLLMQMSELLANAYERAQRAGIPSQDIDVEDVILDEGGNIRTSLERQLHLLQEEMVDADHNISALQVFRQHFLGPIYDANHGSHMETLCTKGLVNPLKYRSSEQRRGIAPQPDLFALAGMKDPEQSSNIPDTRYEPISPYFVDQILSCWQESEMNDLVGVLTITERRLRNVIKDALMWKFGSDWAEAAKECIPMTVAQKEKFYQDLRRAVHFFGGQESNVPVSILDALSFTEYKAIIDTYWEELFYPIFKSEAAYADKSVWDGDMELLHICRKTRGHANMHIVSPQEQPRIEDVCRRFCRCSEDKDISALLEEYHKGGSVAVPAPKTPSDKAPSVPVAVAPESQPLTKEEKQALDSQHPNLLNKTVTIAALRVGTGNRNFSGVYAYTDTEAEWFQSSFSAADLRAAVAERRSGWKVCLSRKVLDDLREARAESLGLDHVDVYLNFMELLKKESLKVKIIRWDANAAAFNGEFDDPDALVRDESLWRRSAPLTFV